MSQLPMEVIHNKHDREHYCTAFPDGRQVIRRAGVTLCIKNALDYDILDEEAKKISGQGLRQAEKRLQL